MAPSQVSVRVIDAEEPADVESLAGLWVESRPVGRVPAAGRVDRSAISPSTLGRAIARDGVKAFVAALDGHDVGFVVLSRGPLLPLLDEPSVAIEHLFVQEDARRQGVGRALIARATTFAEQGGASQISTSVPAAGPRRAALLRPAGLHPVRGAPRRLGVRGPPPAGAGAVPGPRCDRAASPVAAGPEHGRRPARPQQRLTARPARVRPRSCRRAASRVNP